MLASRRPFRDPESQRKRTHSIENTFYREHILKETHLESHRKRRQRGRERRQNTSVENTFCREHILETPAHSIAPCPKRFRAIRSPGQVSFTPFSSSLLPAHPWRAQGAATHGVTRCAAQSGGVGGRPRVYSADQPTFNPCLLHYSH